MKKCTKCPETNPSAFYKDKSSPDGYKYICKPCDNKRRLAQAQANPEPRLIASRKFYHANIEEERARGRSYASANPEKAKLRSSKHYQENLKEIATYGRQYRLKYPEKNCAKSNKYRAGGLSRTPKCLSELQLDHIKLFYEASMQMTKETGIQFHVDHIVPLKGKIVSGLHVPWNLRVIPAEENLKKTQ